MHFFFFFFMRTLLVIKNQSVTEKSTKREKILTFRLKKKSKCLKLFSNAHWLKQNSLTHLWSLFFFPKMNGIWCYDNWNENTPNNVVSFSVNIMQFKFLLMRFLVRHFSLLSSENQLNRSNWLFFWKISWLYRKTKTPFDFLF